MKIQKYTLELITPCFCAGADPAQAEIRAPSIRGQLRWWFRVLGGSSLDEISVFGAVAGEGDSNASAVIIRISDFKRGQIWSPPKLDPSSPQNYTWHFAAASGKPSKAGPKVTGPRWQQQGAISPGSSFQLTITRIRPWSSDLERKFNAALSAFLSFGTIGLRATRGLGAFHCNPEQPWRKLVEPLRDAGFTIALRQQPETFSSWEAALRDWSSWLRYKFRKENKAARFSALGGIQPRQASAVRFRPIKLRDKEFTWLALEAPHDRVLGSKTAKILSNVDLSGPAPSERQ